MVLAGKNQELPGSRIRGIQPSPCRESFISLRENIPLRHVSKRENPPRGGVLLACLPSNQPTRHKTAGACIACSICHVTRSLGLRSDSNLPPSADLLHAQGLRSQARSVPAWRVAPCPTCGLCLKVEAPNVLLGRTLFDPQKSVLS